LAIWLPCSVQLRSRPSRTAGRAVIAQLCKAAELLAFFGYKLAFVIIKIFKRLAICFTRNLFWVWVVWIFIIPGNIQQGLRIRSTC
jgi:hypothetical protein